VFSDEPISLPLDDELSIAAAATALVDFLESATSPLSVSIQGEWGSGKTTLMRLVQSELATRSGFKTIVVDSWEYSLGGDPTKLAEQITLSIIGAITEVTHSDRKLTAVAREVQNFLAKGTALFASFQGGDGELVKELLQHESDVTKRLRDAIASLTMEADGQRFVVFVDDLDRVEPAVAIETLEMLRNVLFVPNCCFVIAVDFDVVALGLQQRYSGGGYADEHVRRDYFDKLFQFSYFVSANPASARRMLRKGLYDTGYFSESESSDHENLTLGTILSLVRNNPRRIKRVLNSIQYRQLLDRLSGGYVAGGSTELRGANAILTTMTLVYPEFVRALMLDPDFKAPSQAHWRSLAQRGRPETASRPAWTEEWIELIRLAGHGYIASQLVDGLSAISELMERDRRLNFRVLLGISQFISPSIGEVGVGEGDFGETVTTPVRYGLRLLDRVSLSNDAKVLHLACQDGTVTRMMLERYPAISVDAVEMQRGLFDAAADVLRSLLDPLDRCTLSLRPIEDIDFYHEFDVVFSVTAFHWLGSGAYVKAYDALKPGGRIIVEQSMAGTYVELRNVLFRAALEFGLDLATDIDPFYMPTDEQLGAWLSGLGFEDVLVSVESDDVEDLDALYLDYAHSNAKAYLDRIQGRRELTSNILERFMEMCRVEGTGGTAQVGWVTATKAAK